MIKYDGMKAEESKSSSYGQLPAGPYVAKVLKAEIEGTYPDQQLKLALDVVEGEYKDFFMNKFTEARKAGSKYGEVKFKGVYKLRIPNSDNPNAKYPESDQRRMNDLIYRFQSSNQGFHFDGDEQKLVGKIVGINMQEDSYNGNPFTRIGKLETADDVRKGLVKAMKPRERKDAAPDPLAPTTTTATTGFTQVEINTAELPF